jgi:hypothetical protein
MFLANHIYCADHVQTRFGAIRPSPFNEKINEAIYISKKTYSNNVCISRRKRDH